MTTLNVYDRLIVQFLKIENISILLWLYLFWKIGLPFFLDNEVIWSWKHVNTYYILKTAGKSGSICFVWRNFHWLAFDISPPCVIYARFFALVTSTYIEFQALHLISVSVSFILYARLCYIRCSFITRKSSSFNYFTFFWFILHSSFCQDKYLQHQPKWNVLLCYGCWLCNF